MDTEGLVSREALGVNIADLVKTHQPPWIVSYDTHIPDEVRNSAWFQQQYRPVRQYAIWDGRYATLYRHYPPPASAGGRAIALGSFALLEDYHITVHGPPAERIAHLDLIWRARQPISKRYTMFVHLVHDKGNRLAQQDNQPQEGTYPTTSWQSGQLVMDQFDLRLPSDLDLRELSVQLGAYETEATAQLATWTTSAGTSLGASLRLPLTPPRDEENTCSVWVGSFLLTRVTMSTRADDDEAAVTLSWRTTDRVEDDYTVFVHLLDGNHGVVAQHDSQPRLSTLPTSTWLSGDLVQDDHPLAAEAAVLRATDAIAIGMYDLKTGRRLPVGEGSMADAVQLPVSFARGDHSESARHVTF